MCIEWFEKLRDYFLITQDAQNDHDYIRYYDQSDDDLFNRQREAQWISFDIFVIRLYKYFQGKGYCKIILSQIVSLLSIIFLVGFSVFLVQCVDWHTLRHYNDTEYLKLHSVVHGKGLLHPRWWIVISLLVFIVFLYYKISKLLHDAREIRHLKSFVNNELQIDDSLLNSITWPFMVEKFQQYYRASVEVNGLPGRIHLPRLPFDAQSIFSEEPPTVYEIASVIMREDNYFIGIMDNVLPFTLQSRTAECKGQSQYHHLFSKTLEWNLKHAVIKFIFDKDLKVDTDFADVNNIPKLTEKLEQRIKIMAIINLVLIPFLFIYSLVYIVFNYGEKFYKYPNTLGTRQWSLVARWKFREYNELPHNFVNRMELGARYARKYISECYTGSYFDILAKFVVLVFSTVFVVLLFMTLMNDNMLIYLELTGGASVIWYLGTLGSLIAFSRTFILDRSLSKKKCPKKSFTKMSEHVHYIPPEWCDEAYKTKIKNKLLSLYEFQIVSLIKEIAGIVITPFAMLFIVRKYSEAIVRFVNQQTIEVPRIGKICKLSSFEDSDISSQPAADNDKLTKSIMQFRQDHPDWNKQDLIELAV